MTTATNATVAQTIIDQLGGRGFIAMTGARNLHYTATTLSFQLPSRFAKDGINAITITLTPADTYTVRFAKTWGMKFKELATVEDVYNDQLRRVFTERTGLDCTL